MKSPCGILLTSGKSDRFEKESEPFGFLSKEKWVGRKANGKFHLNKI
jgi:hypothetical protein